MITSQITHGAGPAQSVSVIITTYNHVRFLREAIESALTQTEGLADVIVVDDGSTDDPAATVALFLKVRLIRQANQGLAAARNTGWRASHSRYVVFLDADDRLLPHALACNLRRFAQNPDWALVYGAYRFIDAEGCPLAEVPLAPIEGDAFEALLRGNCIGMHATVMYRRDRLEEVGGFDPSLRACEDYDLYLRLARRYPVACSRECLAEYRRHHGNMSNNAPLMLASALAVLRRQRPGLAADPRWRTAYRSGLRAWKTYYAADQLRRARDLIPMPGQRRALLRDVASLSCLAPIAVSQAALSASLRFLRGRMWLVAFGTLRRTTPISLHFGYDRGKPVDRRFIEHFLALHIEDIRGQVLEVGDSTYTARFGGNRVTRSDVLHFSEGNPRATLVGDLADGDHLPSGAFDCIVLTQTLHLVYDVHRAVATLHRLLRPGGVLLVTVPGVSSVDRGEWGPSWYWSFTPAALRRLLEEQFAGTGLMVTAYGNVLTALAFLHGLAESELRVSELDIHDPHYPVIVAARAVKEVGREHA